MGFFGNIARALGFESEEQPIKARRTRKTESKATFNLKKDKIERPDKIDGIRVVYIEKIDDMKKAFQIFNSDEPVLINIDYADDKSRALGYLEGAMLYANGSMQVIEENRLLILLPEGVEIE